MVSEHMRQMYITSTREVGATKKRTCLVIMCTRCGTEHVTEGFDVAAVMKTATAHIEAEDAAG